MTEKTDVYSFGVLLMELVTGKRPTDPSFVKRGLNIVGWVSVCIFFCRMYKLGLRILPPFLQMNILSEEDLLEDVVDPKCSGIEMESVEAVLDIAAMCTDARPDDRPSMGRVLQMLEEVVLTPCPSDLDF